MKFKKINILGQFFGYLEVIQDLGRIDSNAKRPVYKHLCKCICGKEKQIETIELKKGSVKSCGCMTKKLQSDAKMKPDGEAAFHNIYLSYKINCAKKRNLIFDLTKEQFKILIDNDCYYCNKEPSQIKKSKFSFYKYNGIDRVDNSKGYTIDNCVSCCKQCNSLKSGITKELVEKLYNLYFKNV